MTKLYEKRQQFIIQYTILLKVSNFRFDFNLSLCYFHKVVTHFVCFLLFI